MLSNIYAFKQPPCQIACGRRTEEISDCQSNQIRYPENHRIHLDALISGNPHVVVYLFDRVVGRLVPALPRKRRGGWAGSVAFPRRPVIQTLSNGDRIMRYELADCEWDAI